MNKEEHIQVITDREELYDKCENMEQLYDKYYLPLLDKHYRKTYELQQENQQLKEVIDKIKTRYIDYYGTTKEVNDDYVLRSVLKEISDLLNELNEEE